MHVLILTETEKIARLRQGKKNRREGEELKAVPGENRLHKDMHGPRQHPHCCFPQRCMAQGERELLIKTEAVLGCRVTQTET